MNGTPWPARPRSRPAVALTMLVHLALLALFVTSMRSRVLDRSSTRLEPLIVRLWPETPAPRPMQQPRLPQTARDERVSRPEPLQRPRPVSQPSATPSWPIAAAAATPASAASAPPPLNLRLADKAVPAETLRSQMLNDPRVVTRPSYGERFAATLGTDTALHEERLNDGSLRLRQGTSCVIVKEGAAARLDPFNQTYTPAPKLVGKCPE